MCVCLGMFPTSTNSNYFYTHINLTIHVWYIYLHVPQIEAIHVGKFIYQPWILWDINQPKWQLPATVLFRPLRKYVTWVESCGTRPIIGGTDLPLKCCQKRWLNSGVRYEAKNKQVPENKVRIGGEQQQKNNQLTN